MSPQNRLALFLDATLKLALVNPNAINDVARKVVADPDHYPARTVECARAVLAEEEEQQTRKRKE